jgi:ATP-dependent DNA helicase RecQ
VVVDGRVGDGRPVARQKHAALSCRHGNHLRIRCTGTESERGARRGGAWLLPQRRLEGITPRQYVHERRGGRTKIPEREQLEPGRSLSAYKDPGWGTAVQHGREEAGRFGDDLVDAATELLTEWDPAPAPTWVTAVPSTQHDGLVVDLAERIAAALDLPFVDAITCPGDPVPQAALENSYQQCWNVTGAFEATGAVRGEPVLLVDDIVGSRWTVTEVGRILRRAGSGPVHPFTLAERRAW